MLNLAHDVDLVQSVKARPSNVPVLINPHHATDQVVQDLG